MISLDVAGKLKDTGLRWSAPANGDRFVIPRPGLEAEAFVVSDMTVEVQDVPVGMLITFNGTTEWALDSVEESAVVWLPSEEQLRGLLGGTFVALRRGGPGGFAVETVVNGTAATYRAASADEAYAEALLALLQATS